MNASKKMTAYGLKALAHQVGHDLVTVYRWKKALESGGSVKDSVKHKLIAATSDSSQPITWDDFRVSQ